MVGRVEGGSETSASYAVVGITMHHIVPIVVGHSVSCFVDTGNQRFGLWICQIAVVLL